MVIDGYLVIAVANIIQVNIIIDLAQTCIEK